MGRKSIFLFIAIFVVSSTVSAKEFVLNCTMDGGAQLVFTFNEETSTVSSAGVDSKALFSENAIVFSAADWVHQVSRVTGQMIASKDGKNVTLKCNVVSKRMF